SRPTVGLRIVFDFKDSQNINIGAANKGNLIRGGNRYSLLFENCKNIYIKGNLIGWDISEGFDYHSPGIHFLNSDQIFVGGNNEKDKNFLYVTVFIRFTKPINCKAEIIGNNFGVLDNEIPTLWFIQGHARWIYIDTQGGSSPADYASPDVLIKDNVFWNMGIGIFLRQVNGNQRVGGNYYGATRNDLSMGISGNMGTFLKAEIYNGRLIVGDDIDGGNTINLASAGIETYNAYSPKISNNKFTCINSYNFKVYSNDFPTFANQNLSITNFAINANSYKISGTSDPNSIVEVYDSDNCYPPKCKPKSRIGKISADASGNWEFTSSTNPITYFFSATSNQHSTEFKSFNITENLIIQKAQCNQLGKLIGLEAYLALNPKVFDLAGNLIPISQLNALPVGKYTITVDGACAVSTFEIELIVPVTFGLPEISKTDNTCGLENGSITISRFNGKTPIKFEWLDDNGIVFSTHKDIANLKAGNYTLYGKDENDCSQLIGKYEIKLQPLLVLDKSNVAIGGDICGASTGSISDLNITGGVGPFKTTWFDSKGNIVGQTLSIDKLKAGIYSLTITDQFCTNTYTDFMIPFEGKTPPSILQEDITLCGPGELFLQAVKVIGASKYNLYNASGKLLLENEDGLFKLKIENEQELLLSYKIDDCESSFSKFKVSFSTSKLKIASAFSPNNDGVNDYWEVSQLFYYPNVEVLVFNRFGKIVYQAKGKSPSFDGNFEGKQLSAGVYYYTINLNTDCEILSGSLTLIR
ncbi:MAG: T9SS type B sorting domain-containing protein, partial [Flavobacterium sp.]